MDMPWMRPKKPRMFYVCLNVPGNFRSRYTMSIQHSLDGQLAEQFCHYRTFREQKIENILRCARNAIWSSKCMSSEIIIPNSVWRKNVMDAFFSVFLFFRYYFILHDHNYRQWHRAVQFSSICAMYSWEATWAQQKKIINGNRNGQQPIGNGIFDWIER